MLLAIVPSRPAGKYGWHGVIAAETTRVRSDKRLLPDQRQRSVGLKRARSSPHLFEIIEFADLGAEDVNDHVAARDQHPIAVRQSFDVEILDAKLAESFGDVLSDSADVPVDPAGGDDHEIGHRRFAAKVDRDRVFRLHIVEAGEDQAQGLVGVRPRRYDLQGRF